MGSWAVSGCALRLVVLGAIVAAVPFLRRWVGVKGQAYLVVMGGLAFLMVPPGVNLAGRATWGGAWPGSGLRDDVLVNAAGYVTICLGLLWWLREFHDERNRLVRDNADLQVAASTDFLTELVSRRFLRPTLERELARGRRYGVPVAVIMADLDHFKRINDEHGHLVGDGVLRHVAEVLKGRLRASDALVRYGGEEFLLIVPEAGQGAAGRLAETLRARIESTPAVVDRREVPVRASFGVAVAEPGAGDSVPEIVRRADAALYAAKRTGRNRVVCWDALAEPGGEAPAGRAEGAPVPAAPHEAG